MPRPIPDDVENVTGFIWYLIPVPDDPVFVQAAWDAFTELTKPWNWGKEGRVPESDIAAQKWSDAIYEALRVRDMGFPDDILTYIDEVETLLESILEKSPCCDDAALYDELTDPDGIVDPETDETGGDIVVGEGDPPGEIPDWPTYHDELCDRATRFADGLLTWVQFLEGLSSLTQIGLAAVLAGLLLGLNAVGIATAAIAIGVLDVLDILDQVRTLLGAPPPWQDAKDEISDPAVKEQIRCAILHSSTPAEAETEIDEVLSLVAPNAAGVVGILPLRFMLNKVFNAETDAGGFGGSTCTCPLPCLDCLPPEAVCRESVNVTFVKQQGSCTNYTIDSQQQIAPDIWECVWSVNGTNCSIVSVHATIDNTPQAAIMELVTAERISGTEPLTFEGVDALDPANWGHKASYSIPSTWRTCVASHADVDHGGAPATFFDFTSARPGPAQFRMQVRVRFAAD